MSDPTTQPRPPIPGVFRPAHRLAQALARPLSEFLHVQASSGLLLLAASVAALALANSRFHDAYEHLWHVPISLGIGSFSFVRPVHFWINDGLMVIFFFVVGLEIRREIHAGELSEPKRAALPAICALGGMIAPALIYFALNRAPPTNRGWGVPMATDIAFAVGVLALLGKRVPAAIRVLLLALAIIDDIGAILVIAVFYSSSFSWIGLGVAAAGVLGVLALKSAGARHPLAYVIPGVVLWAGLLKAGIHPTIAGVILGLLTPARAWYGVSGFVATAEGALAEVRARAAEGRDAHDFLAPLDRVAEARREALPQVVRIEAALHPWVAFGIMPLFAFANAGVRLGGVDLGDPSARSIAVGVVAGLCAGKPIGVILAALVAVKLGVAARPRGVTWRGVMVVGLVAGIGFTMAIFIASLAFADPGALAAAKLAILAASAIAAALALSFGRLLLPPPSVAEGPTTTPDEAEASTEA